MSDAVQFIDSHNSVKFPPSDIRARDPSDTLPIESIFHGEIIRLAMARIVPSRFSYLYLVHKRCSVEKIALAQTGYHAYCTWLAWKTPSGSNLLSWSELPMALQNAWTSAAEVIAIETRKENDNTTVLKG